MHIDKFKKGDEYVDSDGCHYENAVDFIQIKLFGFCACGRPEDNLVYVRDTLRILMDSAPAERDEKESFEAFWEKYREKVDSHFKSKDAEYFMWYWLDKQGYTEHGGSVPGWLTTEGRELLEDLEEMKNEIEGVD